MRFISFFIALYVVYYCRCDVISYTDNEFAEFEVADDSFKTDNTDNILENPRKAEYDQEHFSENDDVGVDNEVVKHFIFI